MENEHNNSNEHNNNPQMKKKHTNRTEVKKGNAIMMEDEKDNVNEHNNNQHMKSTIVIGNVHSNSNEHNNNPQMKKKLKKHSKIKRDDALVMENEHNNSNEHNNNPQMKKKHTNRTEVKKGNAIMMEDEKDNVNEHNNNQHLNSKKRNRSKIKEGGAIVMGNEHNCSNKHDNNRQIIEPPISPFKVKKRDAILTEDEHNNSNENNNNSQMKQNREKQSDEVEGELITANACQAQDERIENKYTTNRKLGLEATAKNCICLKEGDIDKGQPIIIRIKNKVILSVSGINISSFKEVIGAKQSKKAVNTNDKDLNLNSKGIEDAIYADNECIFNESTQCKPKERHLNNDEKVISYLVQETNQMYKTSTLEKKASKSLREEKDRQINTKKIISNVSFPTKIGNSVQISDATNLDKYQALPSLYHSQRHAKTVTRGDLDSIQVPPFVRNRTKDEEICDCETLMSRKVAFNSHSGVKDTDPLNLNKSEYQGELSRYLRTYKSMAQNHLHGLAADSYFLLRHMIRTYCKPCSKTKKLHFNETNHFSYPHAPLGEIWINRDHDMQEEILTLKGLKNLNSDWLKDILSNEQKGPPELNSGGSLLGRRWVWDEGHYTDGHCITKISADDLETFEVTKENLLAKHNNVPSLLKKKAAEKGVGHMDKRNSTKFSALRAYCDCGIKHTSEQGSYQYLRSKMTGSPNHRKVPRRSERAVSSTSMSNVLTELAKGNLNPHTLIICDEYTAGPEFRFLLDEFSQDFESLESTESGDEITSILKSISKYKELEKLCLRKDRRAQNALIQSKQKYQAFAKLSSFKKSQIQPFAVRVCPDATFLVDLHSHLCESEIIGLLGGRYVSSERCIYVQAAFPCKSTSRSDSGFTDVEMDPISQVTAGDAIVRHGMTVVGWYHSHPKFQPDPSVTDIENQGNYQKLFQNVLRRHTSNLDNTNNNNKFSYTSPDSSQKFATESSKNTNPTYLSSVNYKCTKNLVEKEDDDLCPFVGLIVGTYDSQNPSSQSVMRWFHVTKSMNNQVRIPRSTTNKSVNFPRSLQVSHRKFRKFSIANSQKEQDNTVVKLKQKLTQNGQSARRQLDIQALKLTFNKTNSDSQLGSHSEETQMMCDEKNPNSDEENIHVAHVKESAISIRQDQMPSGGISVIKNDGGYCEKKSNNEKSLNSTDDKRMTQNKFKPASQEMTRAGGSTLRCENSRKEPNSPLCTTQQEPCVYQVKENKNSCDASSFVPVSKLSNILSSNGMTKVIEDYYEAEMAHPLPYTKEELEILRLGHQDGVTNDVRGGVIWNAVERDQHLQQQKTARQSDVNTRYEDYIIKSSSSQSILELLLAPQININVSEEESFATEITDDDAIFVHTIDAVLNHYATDSHRIDPFKTWSGAGDKGMIRTENNIHQKLYEEGQTKSVLSWWQHYYMSKVISSSNGKMKRGHKLTSCLLRWSAHLQLNERDVNKRKIYEKETNIFRDENCNKLPKDVEFVSEIMRLLAARWRESSESKRRKRGRELCISIEDSKKKLSLNGSKKSVNKGKGHPRNQ